MEKKKAWQFYLILSVVILTFYNILPTVFYYAQPLKKPVGVKEASHVAEDMMKRVNHLEKFTISWLKAQSKNLKLKPLSVSLDATDPRLAKIIFKKEQDAQFFAQTLLKAGAIIPFVPAEITPVDVSTSGDKAYVVTVQRKIGIHFDPSEKNQYFKFIPKKYEGQLTQEYRDLIQERAFKLALGFGGISETGRALLSVVEGKKNSEESALRLARSIVDFENSFGDSSDLTKRYFSSFTQVSSNLKKSELIEKFIGSLETTSKSLDSKISSLNEEKAALQKEGKFLEHDKAQSLTVLEGQKTLIDAAKTILRRDITLFTASQPPLLNQDPSQFLSTAGNVEVISLENRNPFVKALVVNWDKEAIDIILHDDVNQILHKNVVNEADAVAQEKLNILVFNAMGNVARQADENIVEGISNFTVSLNKLTNSNSLLVLNLKTLAAKEIDTLSSFIEKNWKTSNELSNENFPIYKNIAPEKEKLGLIFYSPLLDSQAKKEFRPHSIYVILRGFQPLVKKYDSLPDSAEKKAFEKDFASLNSLLKQNGFSGYVGASGNLPSEFASDYVFELPEAYNYLIGATREDFSLKGNKEVAILEFTDVEQRLLTLNKIETREHEDLVKWRDDYQAAQVSIDRELRYDVPKPTQSVLLSNLKLSMNKYFRGDERKILKWGLDLSGGKTVKIGLKNQNNQLISDEGDIREAINELYKRVNKLGVSEVNIHQEGSSIVIDFPGSQGLSATELVKASAMYFHVVNEKFGSQNPLLSEAVNTFLDEVWNEAVVTNKKDSESVQEIAWTNLGGNYESGDFYPVTSHAKLLYDNGLRLANPKDAKRSSSFDDSLSQVSILRGDNFTEWMGQTNPLLIVFHNYVLEGANLTDVQTGYDPSEGNVLYFGVKSSDMKEGQRVNPRDDFYTWTSQFSEEKIVGTAKEQYSQGRGWRMAVILNGSIVSAPTLNSPLRDSARITGHFSQREINALASDLKAGSLSFTPYILSEENVSPDLGKEQRVQGILAATIGVLLVIIAMCGVYRFGGVVACVAVLFNLLILWAVLQNLSAALTLPGIAGIILSVGMAVDANVLVFERIREEFSKHGRLPSAIQSGYRRAFSAIFDSNITTIIAALILLNFDSGPIKGFALTLIIGIISSMFSSLFMTRFFFAGWVQNPKHTELKMAKLFHETKFNFLKRAKPVIVGSILIMVVGLYFLYAQRTTIFGMDFTGGYALTMDLEEKPNTNYRLAAQKALLNEGLSTSDFQVRELNKPNQLRLQLSIALEESGKVFHKIDERKTPESVMYVYQNYPRIVWIVNALEKEGLKIAPQSLSTLNLHWSEMSGQLSDTMRTQALIGLGLALLAILIYITLRFEFNYAISATIGLIHDVLITVAALAILHYFFYEVQIDLQVIAALMTIVGYSLNDTIIIFDRIREDLKVHKKLGFTEIVNHALNATLNRTIMTSGTTLLVLLALVLFGGKVIFTFSLILAIGVAIGTLSSLFVAAPLLVYFYQRSLKTEVVKQS